jgi:membrane associated rhomboid family serine protease
MGGVAWFAHVGGFLAGVVLAKLFAPKQERKKYESLL